MIQKVGEYIVTFADAYHMGYNAGFNLWEAVNFMLHEDIPMSYLNFSIFTFRVEISQAIINTS